MDYIHPSIGDILLISLIGFVTVFIVLIVLMCIIILISKIFGEKKAAAPAAIAPSTIPVAEQDDYTGVKLHGVPDQTAALLMAIVADDLQMPLDNLRFISIREIGKPQERN